MELPKWKGKINKLWQLICGNGIAKMGGKKIVPIDLWQCCCQNGREKKNVTIGCVFWNCQNGREKKELW